MNGRVEHWLGDGLVAGGWSEDFASEILGCLEFGGLVLVSDRYGLLFVVVVVVAPTFSLDSCVSISIGGCVAFFVIVERMDLGSWAILDSPILIWQWNESKWSVEGEGMSCLAWLK